MSYNVGPTPDLPTEELEALARKLFDAETVTERPKVKKMAETLGAGPDVVADIMARYDETTWEASTAEVRAMYVRHVLLGERA